MRAINRIIIHCADTPPDMDIGVDEVRDWHVTGNNWADVGYHIIVRRSGECEPGRGFDKAGAHAKGHNADSIGLCLIGGRGKDGKPDCNFTAAQWGSLEAVVRRIWDRYGQIEVIGHRDVSDKACPCFDARAWSKTL